MLRKNKIAAAVAGVICTFAGSQAFSQEVQEVVVTGIKGSLQRAMDIKRDSTGVVDAISAEDMGKFPDTNLAESLQRITGVSIDRVNGEGSQVTVRGFGGAFNMVTLNGRQMPSASVGGITGNSNDSASQGTSRSFDFANLASEGVAGIQVYKTGNATVPTGGIGATINIQTLKPLTAGNQASVGVKAVNDESGDDSVTPEASAMVSWANDLSTFGISAFGSYQERSFGGRVVQVAGYQFFDYSDNLSFLQNAEVVNAPAEGALMALPNNMSQDLSESNRERTNAMVTMQFAPSDQLTLTADAMYTQNQIESDILTPGIWYSRAFTFLEFDGSNVVATPTRLIEVIAPPDGRGKDLFHASWANATVDEIKSFGFNAEFQVSDTLTLVFDAATGEATSEGDGPLGVNSWRANVASAGAGWQAAYYGGATPTASVGVIENTGPAFGNGNGMVDAGDLGTQTLRRITSTQESNIDQVSFAGKWEVADGFKVDFGVGAISTEMKQFHSESQDFLGGWGVGQGDVDTSLVTQVCVSCAFEDLDVPGYPDQQPPAGYVPTILGQESFQVDPVAFAMAYDGQYGYDFDNPTQAAYDDNIIEEDAWNIFVSATIDGEVAGMTTQTSVGLRYESTDVTSTTNQSIVTRMDWISDNDFFQNFSSDLTTLDEGFKYHNLLPSIDFAIDLTEQWKVRASLSQTMARPQYSDMFVTTSITNPQTLIALGGFGTATKGSARLEPLESTNFDVSVEYYYGDANYVSAGYYRKLVNNFVGTEQVDQELFGLKDPTSGAPGTLSGDAAEALMASGFSVNEQNMFTMAAILDNPQDFPNGAADYIDPSQPGGTDLALAIIGLYDITPSANDPAMIFTVAQPVNTETALVEGWEVAFQHFFGETGFGIQANATIVEGDVGYDVGAPPSVSQFAIEGLSNSANFIGMYEKEGLSARIAYNWRDEFLADTAFAAGIPIFIDTYSQIDFNISYSFNDNFTVALDGINVTGEGTEAFSRTKRMKFALSEGDPRYVLSARYSF